MAMQWRRSTRGVLVSLLMSISAVLLVQPPRALAAPYGQAAAAQAPAATTPTGPMLTDCSSSRSRTDTESSPLPESVSALVKLLVMCRDTAQMLIAEGQFGFVFLPAMEGKDVALALEDHVDGLAVAEKRRAISAIRRLVIAAWRVDADGDTGNKERLSASYDLFAAAIKEVTSAYGAQ